MRTLPKISYYLRQWRCIRCGAFDFGSNSCTSKKKSHINVKGSKCWVDGKVFFWAWNELDLNIQCNPLAILLIQGYVLFLFLYSSLCSQSFFVCYTRWVTLKVSQNTISTFFYEFFMTVFLLIKTVHRIFTWK